MAVDIKLYEAWPKDFWFFQQVFVWESDDEFAALVGEFWIFKLPSWQWRWSIIRQEHKWHRLYLIRARRHGGVKWGWHWLEEER